MWASSAGAVSSIAAGGGRHTGGLRSASFSPITAQFHSNTSTSSSLVLLRFSNVRWRVLLASASSRKSKEKSAPALVEDDEDDFDGFEDEDDDDAFDDDEDDESAPVPFEEMRRWLRNKPLGFGEGKSYDTSIEDQLMEKIERSRQAQAENLRNLKNKAVDRETPKKKNILNVGAKEDSPIGARVRITGLPKKKNIHKDLKLAFIDFPEILQISPSVEGNSKTRDPICKGFAFIDFKSEEAAQKFVELYSRKSILFGRVEKQIMCNIVDKTHLEVSIALPKVEREFKKEAQKEASAGPKKEAHVGLREKSPRKKREKAPVSGIQGSALRLKVKERAVLSGVFSKYGGQNVEEGK